jgi:hypothetical protein
MTVRFFAFVLVLAVGLGAVGYGLTGNTERVYQKPDPRDDPTVLTEDYSTEIGELELTALVSRMSLDRHQPTGELIDLAQNAPCQS